MSQECQDGRHEDCFQSDKCHCEHHNPLTPNIDLDQAVREMKGDTSHLNRVSNIK